ncbi:methylmalonyl Co-A mutase-associated GTPase MeaB [bacterium]|nr:methylmalonyl Co-A mutase-associated GTPase MeaB [bacterium]
MPNDTDDTSKQSVPPRSALHVMKGVEGGHEGLPGYATDRPGRPRGKRTLSTEEYVKGILDGDRTLLARAITLVESNAPAHQEQAQEVLQAVMPHTGHSIRVGITGVPGAGKSTLIETLGTSLTERGHKLAVMAVDPTSSLSGGSILGDKTRMEGLARDTRAFIRPSPSGGALGGVARKTRETMLLFEAAGYDVLFVETVGVGQNEITVRSMVDYFLLVLIAGAGDELQGIKKGVIELADTIVINKADGDNIRAARAARAEYEQALHYLRPPADGRACRVLTASAQTGDGIKDLWNDIEAFREEMSTSGAMQKRRREQSRQWLHSMLDERLRDLFYRQPAIRQSLPDIEKQVMEGRLPVTAAAWKLLETFQHGEDAAEET